MTQNFKNVLNDIFYQQKKSSDMNDMIIDSLPLPASVTVKGPLNVQQYYDLSGKKIIYEKEPDSHLTVCNYRNKSNTFKIWQISSQETSTCRTQSRYITTTTHHGQPTRRLYRGHIQTHHVLGKVTIRALFQQETYQLFCHVSQE